jgi:D-alanyl-D-alanine carboxypeptidase (penicillin-binding protein 5/6)
VGDLLLFVSRVWMLWICCLLSAVALAAGKPANAQDSDTKEDPRFSQFLAGGYPNPHSKFCVLMDANTGKVLYSRNPHAKRPNASTTKMVACLVLLQHGKLTDTVTAPAGIEHTEESSLHLVQGEQISLQDLLYAMMLRSANDTPIAGGDYLAGSVPKFVDLMNDEVKSIGCRETHFVTPNGLYAPNHYSTPYDLALIARYAMATSPMFRDIVKTQRYELSRSIRTRDNIVKNTALTFLKVFPGADGVKTGYVRQAGHCFVGSATRDGWRLVAVALNSSTCRSDVMQMLSYGFANYKPVLVYKKDTPVGNLRLDGVSSDIPVKTAADLCNVIANKDADAPPPAYTTRLAPLKDRPAGDVHVGDKVGTVVLEANGVKVMTADAIATADVSAGLISKVKDAFSSGTAIGAGTMVPKVLWWIVVGTASLYLGFSIYGRTTSKNHRRRRPRVAPR